MYNVPFNKGMIMSGSNVIPVGSFCYTLNGENYEINSNLIEFKSYTILSHPQYKGDYTEYLYLYELRTVHGLFSWNVQVRMGDMIIVDDKVRHDPAGIEVNFDVDFVAQ